MSNARNLIQSISQSVIGKPENITLVVTAFIAGGHVLLEDMPGTGKTLLAKSLAQSFEGSFKRIQFTSDMMPSDITGNSVYNMKIGEFEFIQGPIFANIILADEINRATPRSQSSLLEVMEENQVSIDGKTYFMAKPFFVIATQNPLESYGTFPLPESQLDRFMISLTMGYPSPTNERTILNLHRENTLRTHTHSLHNQLKAIVNDNQIENMSAEASKVEMSDEVEDYLIRIIQATRQDIRIALGASTRAAVSYLRMAQAFAHVSGRNFVIPDDIKYLAPYILTHRISLKQPMNRQEKADLIQELALEAYQKSAVKLHK